LIDHELIGLVVAIHHSSPVLHVHGEWGLDARGEMLGGHSDLPTLPKHSDLVHRWRQHLQLHRIDTESINERRVYERFGAPGVGEQQGLEIGCSSLRDAVV
jgi:hypothetical protein